MPSSSSKINKYWTILARQGKVARMSILPQPDADQPAADRHQIFEQIALERLRSSADSQKPIGFLPLPVRLTVIAATAISGFGVLWACLARVPVQVNGVASIAPQAQVSSALARVDGVLAYQVSGVDPNLLSPTQIRSNQALAQFWREAVVKNDAIQSYSRLTQLALSAMAPLPGQDLAMPGSERQERSIDNLRISQATYQAINFNNSEIIARIDNAGAMEELDTVRRATLPQLKIEDSIISDRQKRFGIFNDINKTLSLQYIVQEQELKEREALLNRLQALWRNGFVSTAQLLQEESVINGLRNQLLQINIERHNNNFASTDQRQQVGQSSLNRLQTTNQLQAALATYISNVYTITPPSGMYIVTKATRNGMQVRAGDELFTYSTQKPTLPEVIPIFVDAAVSQQLSQGMQVLVTPRGISRAQYGGIPGVVIGVGKLPLPSEGIAAFAGGRTLADSIQQAAGGTYLARVKLELAEPAYCQQMLSMRCYRWSTSRRPPFPVRLGTLADVQINVQYRRPIEFVMPAVRQALGLVVENR
jgi:hypothetical protein